MGRQAKILGIPVNGEKCSYGCELSAVISFVNGNHSCDSNYSRCPAVRLKNSNSLKRVHADGSKGYTYNPKSCWMRGHTAKTHPTIARFAENNRNRQESKERLSAKDQLAAYRHKCRWNSETIKENIDRLLGFELLKIHGMYHKTKNKQGVVRDHRFSIYDGFNQKVSSDILNHPANCRFISQLDNARKTKNSEITLTELMEEIKKWDEYSLCS